MVVRSRGRQDLRLKLLAVYLIFVIPIFAAGYFIYLNASHRLRADVAAADLSLARAIALETDEVLLKSKEAVITFAEMPEVVAADPVGMERAFSAGAAARPDINLFYRLSANGIMLYHYPSSPGSTLGQNFSFREYFKLARTTGGHVFSQGRISPTTSRPVVTSVMPIYAGGRFDGVVATNLELQRLSDTIERLGQETPQNSTGEIIVIDSAGQIIAHSEVDKLLTTLPPGLSGVRQVLLGKEGSLTAADGQGIEWLYSHTPIPSAGWGAIVQRPTNLAFASLASFQRALAWAFVFFGAGALLFWLVLSSQVINPIEELTRYGERVTRAEVETQIEREAILSILQRRDQFGRLTDTLLRAEDGVRARLLELTTLNKTSAAVISTLDTGQVIEAILDEIQRLLSVRQCALLVVNKATQRLEVRASRELGPAYPQAIDLTDNSVQSLPAVRVLTSGQIIQVPDMDSTENFLTALSAARSEGYRTGLIIPLKAPHIPGAVLAIYRADAQRFSQREISLAANFANHAAIALEHAILFSLTDAELQKQVQFLSALNQVGRTVSQSLVMDDILKNAMDAVTRVMTADACWIYLLRHETEAFLRLRAHQGLPAQLVEQLQTKHIYPGEGVMGWVAQHGQPLVLDELNLNRIGWADEPIIDELNWRSLVAVPLLAQESVIGVLGLASKVDRVFHYGEVNLLQAIGDQIVIAVVNARLYRRSRELATVEERNRMAREIHDTLAQGFTGILVQLQAAERLSLKNPDKALSSLRDARELAHQSLQEARRSVFNLRPTVLEELHLDEAIARQVERFQVETGLKADFLLDGYPSPLTPEIEQNLYRITQEALTNVQRHAHASNVSVTLAYRPEQVSLSIIDDGCGLKQPSLNGGGSAWPHKAGHFGLVGIQERAHLLGGLASFESPPAGGTHIRVEIPR